MHYYSISSSWAHDEAFTDQISCHFIKTHALLCNLHSFQRALIHVNAGHMSNRSMAQPSLDMSENSLEYTQEHTLSPLVTRLRHFFHNSLPTWGRLWWDDLVSRVVLITFDFNNNDTHTHTTHKSGCHTIQQARCDKLSCSLTSQHFHFTLWSEHTPV